MAGQLVIFLRTIFIFAAFGFVLSGCRLFSGGDARVLSEVPAPEEPVRESRQDDETALVRECTPINPICAGSDSPVFCQVRSYKNRVLHFRDQISVHGSSACAAGTEITKIACQSRLVPSHLGTMQCVPDGSAGNCPDTPVECDSLTDFTICFADKYGLQDVKRSPGLYSRGTNECDAKNNLKEVACKNNLNPDQLTVVTCGVDETKGECLNLEHICRDDRKKAFCRVTLSKGAHPDMDIRGEGDSRCEAMMAIHREACSRHIKPSALDEIVCFYEK